MLGQTLGSYTIERELGRGGMGAVYAAVHTLLGRRAAVKVLLGELSRDQAQVERFFNEARAATAIKHPSIVEIYDFGWAADGSAYIVMELMAGEPLAARLKRVGRLSVAQAATIARQVATALAAAHRAGIVHRDLKPDNVFLVPDEEVAGGERVKLLDFGIAKLVATGAASRTTTGAIMGTPLYMSPEQCEGARAVDHRTDLYALGCVLFEMVAGRVPFISDGVGGLIGMHLHVPPPRLRELAPDAPAELEAIVARLLAKAPGDRYQTADEVAVELARVAGVAITAPGRAASGPAVAPVSAPAAGGATTLSAAASAHEAPSVPAGGGRRGLWIALGGAAVVGGAVIAVVAASGGGAPPAVVASASGVDAAPAASPAVDAAIAIDPLLQPAQRALTEGRLDAAVALAEEILRDDPGNAAAAAIRDQAVRARDAAAALVTARAAIEKLVKGGRCGTARKQAAEAVAALGEPAQPLVALAAGCKESKASSGDAPVDPGVPNREPLPRDQFLASWSGARHRFEQCRSRLQLTGLYRTKLVIAPSGAVTDVTASGADAKGGACLEAAIRTIRFPASGAGLTVNMPVAFKGEPTTGPLPKPPGSPGSPDPLTP